MFDTIIIPLDMSRHAEQSIPVAREEARQHHARLVLIHVIPRPEPPAPSPQIQRCGPAMRVIPWSAHRLAKDWATAHAYLDLVMRRYELPPDTIMQVDVGEPARRIQAEIEVWPNPLLVMTTGNVDVEPNASLSNVVRQILINGRAPVLGVRQLLPERNSRCADTTWTGELAGR